MSDAASKRIAETELIRRAGGRQLVRLGRLRELRESVGVTQAELARALGVSQAAVSRWEDGLRQPTGANAQRLMDTLLELRRLTEALEAGERG